jgi:autotransporter-associated beta strand protein
MRRNSKNAIAAIFSATAAASGAMFARTALAQVEWTAPAGTVTDYGTAANWSTNNIPGGGDAASISNSGTAQISSGSYSVSEIWAGNNNDGTSNGNVLQTGGTLTVNNWLVVGRFNATGIYNFAGGVINQNNGGADVQLFGNQTAGAAATELIVGSGATLTNAGTFDIGEGGGAATTVVNGGAINSNGQLWIGQTGIGDFFVNSGTVTTTNWAVIGRAGGTGTFNLSGGTFVHQANSSGDFEVGSGGNATLNLSGSGTLITNYIRDENNSSQTATINFNGGVIQANNSDSGFIGGHMSNSDVFNLNVLGGGATFNTSTYSIGITEPLVHGSAGPATDGGLTKYGTGTLTLSASNTYNGSTTVNAGTLNITGSVASPVTVNSGATLNLLGSTSSNITVNSGATLGSYSPSGTGGSASGSLTFSGTSTLLVNPNGSQFLTIGGTANASGASVVVVPTITTAPSSPVEILYAPGGIIGSYTGSGANFITSIRGSLSENIAQTELFLTSSGPANLVWTGTSSTNPANWDVQGTANWYNTGTSATDKFYAGDNVTFDDTGSTTNIVIQSGSVFPTTVTFNNSTAKSYSFSGGAIAGSGSVSVVGGGTVTLNQANSYTGATNINNGTLALGSGGSLSASTVVSLGSGSSNGVLRLGDATGAASTLVGGLNVTGTGAGNEVIGGNNGSTSTLTVGSSILVGTAGNPTASLTVGAGANVYGNTGGNPSIGIGPDSGTNGTVTVLTGGTLSADSSDLWVGNNGGVGTLNINGGTVTANGWIAPGRLGGTGTINLTGGALIKSTGNGNLDIGGDGPDSHGYLFQTGGTVTTTTFVVLGENNASEIGVWNLSGGSTTASIASLIIGSSGNGTVNIFGGGQMTSLGTTIVGQNGSAVGTLNVTGATDSTNGLTASYNASISVGAGGLLNIPNGGPDTAIASGSGTNATFNVLAGGTFNAGTGQVFLGNNTGVAVFNVSGTVNVDNYLAPGRIGGTGTVYLNPGGTINVQESDIVHDPVTGYDSINLSLGQTILGGDGTSGQGFLYQTGGSFNSPNAAMILGENGGTSSVASASGVWNISAGTATLTSVTNGFTAPHNFYNSLTIGAGGNGVVNVSGTAQLLAGNVVIAAGSASGSTLASNGALNVSGGTVTVRSIDVGLGGNGVVNVTGGQLSSTSLTLASNPSATGTLSLTGGTLTTTAITAGNSTAAPVFTINGGTLQAGGNTSTLISLPSNVPVEIGSAGATIDTQAYNVAVPATLAGSGGLTKIGTGNLRLSTSNSYSGNTTVSAGTLTVADPNALSTGSVSLANHATLALAATPSAISFTNYNLNAQTPVFVPVVAASQTAVTLTTTTGSDAVSIFDGNTTTINDATGFAASFTFNHATTGPEQTGAQGVVFVLQSASQGTPYTVGGAGGNIAYNGAPGFGYSLAAAVDLFLDRLVTGSGNQSNGVFTTTNAPAENSSPQISTATSGNVSVVYSPGTGGGAGTLTETFTGLFNGSSMTTSVSTSIDAAVALGGSAGGTADAYLGFTSATGGTTEVQTISDFKFNANGTAIPSNNTAAVTIANPVSVVSTAASPASSTIQLAPTANFSSGAVGPITIGTAGTLTVSVGSNAATGVTHGVLTTPSITFGNSSSGTLNIANNALDITGQSYSVVKGMVASGFAGGNWNGPGISSTAAAADLTHLTALGVIQNNQGGSPLYTSTNLFDGLAPGAGDVLVKYTYYGDANLDGSVNSADYALIDNGYLSQRTSSRLSGWYNGDFNYDGVINGSDYTLIDNAFNQQGASLATQIASATSQIAGSGASSAVPEPASGLILGLGAIGLLGRRRKHA